MTQIESLFGRSVELDDYDRIEVREVSRFGENSYIVGAYGIPKGRKMKGTAHNEEKEILNHEVLLGIFSKKHEAEKYAESLRNYKEKVVKNI